MASIYLKVKELEQLLGTPAATTLLNAKGGTTVFVPPKCRPDHWLALLVGEEAASAFSTHVAIGSASGNLVGAVVELPRPSFRIRLAHFRELQGRGLNANDIALAMGVGLRAVRNYRRLAREGQV